MQPNKKPGETKHKRIQPSRCFTPKFMWFVCASFLFSSAVISHAFVPRVFMVFRLNQVFSNKAQRHEQQLGKRENNTTTTKKKESINAIKQHLAVVQNNRFKSQHYVLEHQTKRKQENKWMQVNAGKKMRTKI